MKHHTYAAHESSMKRQQTHAGNEQNLGIEEVTARAGVSERLVHHCQTRGLIQGSQATDAAWRRYSQEDVCVLRFARQAHVLGFGMNEIASLISMWQDIHGSSSEVRHIALAKPRKPKTRVVERQAMACILERLANLVTVAHQPACPILDDLMAHRAC